MRADVNVKKAEEWMSYRSTQPVVNEGGIETPVYANLALRDRPGWVTTAAGAATLLDLMLLVGVLGGET